jgi:CBS domain-containing protein
VQVRDVMTRELVTIGPDAPFKEVAELMVGRHLGALPVVDREGRLLGIVSEADLLPKEADGWPKSPWTPGVFIWEQYRRQEELGSDKGSGSVAADVMSSPVEVASPGESLRSVARRMVDGSLRRLPVVDGGRLVGILTRGDVLRVFARPDAVLGKAIERVLDERGYAHPRHDLEVIVADGVVSLRGLVETLADVEAIGDLVEDMDGVVSVDNLLGFQEVDPPRPSRASAAPRGD